MALTPYNSAASALKKAPGNVVLLAVKGVGDDTAYLMEADPVTGAIATSASQAALAFQDSARLDYSADNVTSGAWVELIASTAGLCRQLFVFESGGYTLELGIGAAASETRLLLIPPGGINGGINLGIAAGSRLSLRAIGAATISEGEIDINLLG